MAVPGVHGGSGHCRLRASPGHSAKRKAGLEKAAARLAGRATLSWHKGPEPGCLGCSLAVGFLLRPLPVSIKLARNLIYSVISPGRFSLFPPGF